MNYVQRVLDALNAECPGLEPELARLYALLALSLGESTALADVHDAWAIWRDTTNPGHRSLVPFDELSLEVQELDREYMEAIHRVAEKLGARA